MGGVGTEIEGESDRSFTSEGFLDGGGMEEMGRIVEKDFKDELGGQKMSEALLPCRTGSSVQRVSTRHEKVMMECKGME